MDTKEYLSTQKTKVLAELMTKCGELTSNPQAMIKYLSENVDKWLPRFLFTTMKMDNSGARLGHKPHAPHSLHTLQK